MKTLELDEGEVALLAALFSSEGLNIPIRTATVAASLQAKIAGLVSNGPRLVKGDA